ncbi:MAG: hypothetical protein ABW250_24085 [Pyrinomonadaceae bacterium]
MKEASLSADAHTAAAFGYLREAFEHVVRHIEQLSKERVAESAREKAVSYRRERLGAIKSGDTPVKLGLPARFVLHVLPVAAFEPAARVDLSELRPHNAGLNPIVATSGSAVFTAEHNADGFAAFANGLGGPYSYTQLFRDGIAEAVRAPHHAEKSYIPVHEKQNYEREIVHALAGILTAQRRLGVEPPLYVMLSLVGVSGHVVLTGEYGEVAGRAIERDEILPRELPIGSYDEVFTEGEIDPTKLMSLMKPAFDEVMQAAALAGSAGA